MSHPNARLVTRIAASLLLGAMSLGTAPAQTAEWPAYGHDPQGTRFSPAKQITRENVGKLALAWTFRTGEMAPEFATRRVKQLEATPIVVDGVMYVSSPLGRVFALDPSTGKQKWVFDPHIDKSVDFSDFANRGVSTWVDTRRAAGAPCRRRIFAVTVDGRLIALDAASGKPCGDFGAAGTIDLSKGLRNAPRDAAEYAETSPPAVIGNLVVVGSSIGDNGRTDLPSGEVRAFDARSGALRWTFDPVPQDSSDKNWSSWKGANAHRTGAANTWSVIAADPARDLVVLPTTSPSPDYFGGERLGDNRYANSVVAIRASTGKVLWHFQTVHHDLWDYDNASPPALVSIPRSGGSALAVLQTTKTGQLFVLDRATGAPIFSVEERAVPASDVPGEIASRTQPFNTVIPALSPQGLDTSDVWGTTPEDRVACLALVGELRNNGVFTPPSLRGTLTRPSNVGGVNWGGVAYDPSRALVIVPLNRIASMVQLIDTTAFDFATARRDGSRLGYEYTRMRGTPFMMRRRILLSPAGAPCVKPPWTTLVAIDLKTGAKRWEVPLGGFLRDGVQIEGVGSVSLGGPIVTAGGVIFIAGTLDRRLRAFDVETGKELWHADLPAGGRATPMTYVTSAGGRQYVVISAGGGKEFGDGDYVMAFALPR
ncbi:MAG: pyrroloquinoline quinone-dependent dehydrogenase [Gemmatimonadota bacterium]|nr:pyrroloquinoline quinone-dependent dehydrogenase [Gemmatimonadota bacterium]